MKNMRRLLTMLLLSATLFFSIPTIAQMGTTPNGTTTTTSTGTRDGYDHDNYGLWGLLGLLGLAGLLGLRRKDDNTRGNTNVNR